ncbi:hypothetical protein H5410_027090 [Solanum commersonii]|uniref:Uncharacterized protein n=1 Tax=Solanum commersonii TaxID=4109 RepID=A0A9J5Z3E3_SOLCO|nr:hypothetical protein H5410_027090 [Solanum commersonii]
MSNLPNNVQMDIEDESTRAIRTFKGYNIYECKIMHPELAREKIDNKEDDNKMKEPNKEGEEKNKNHKKSHEARINQHTGSFPRKLASGKLVGNLEDWNEVTSKRKKGKVYPLGWRDNGDLSALVDEVIDIAAGDIIDNLVGKIIQEDASQSLENIQDDENKTEHIKDIGEQEDSDNTTREEEVQVANNLQLAVIQEEYTVLTIRNKVRDIDQMPDQVLPLQIDESQLCLGNIESPNLTLHNIILKEVKEDQIMPEADLSPRTIIAIKTSRKGKKHGNGENSQPSRVQPKRTIITPNKFK